MHWIEVPKRYHPLWVLPGEAQGAVVAGDHEFSRGEVGRGTAFQVDAVRAEHHVEALRLRERSLHHLHAAKVYVHVVDHRLTSARGSWTKQLDSANVFWFAEERALSTPRSAGACSPQGCWIALHREDGFPRKRE